MTVTGTNHMVYTRHTNTPDTVLLQHGVENVIVDMENGLTALLEV